MTIHTRTRIIDSGDFSVYSGEGVITEGSALVQQIEDGECKVKLSTGTSNDIFMGVAYHQVQTPSTAVKVEDITSPAGGGAISLLREPIGGLGAILVKRPSDNTVMTVQSGAPAAPGQVQLAGDTLVFFAADGNQAYTVTYRYNLTMSEASQLFGDTIVTTAAGTILSTAVIRAGEIWTDMIDTGADWESAGTNIGCGANGHFVVGGPGKISLAYIIHVPSQDLPFLGVYIRC